MTAQLNGYKKALATGKLGFWEWNPVNNGTFWSDETFRLFGYEPGEFDITYDNVLSTLHHEDRLPVMELLRENMKTLDHFEYEYRGLHKQGHIINIWVRLEVLRDKYGAPTGVAGISQDITERKKLEEKIQQINSSLESQVAERTRELHTKVMENELLLKEMHHRVKNNLQVISSILRLQKDYLHDDFAIASLEECISRIKSMALIHESLYSRDNLASIDLKNYFLQLVESHFSESSEIRKQLELPDMQLEIGKMLPLGMIINELISNSVKHGFLNEPKPEIRLRIHTGAGQLHIYYGDNGSGFNLEEACKKPSFGIDLIRTLINDLDSELDVKSDHRGLHVAFSITIS